jgi:hypothetical protein
LYISIVADAVALPLIGAIVNALSAALVNGIPVAFSTMEFVFDAEADVPIAILFTPVDIVPALDPITTDPLP